MGLTTPTGQFSLKDVVYQDAGIYKCIGQSVSNNKKKVEIIHTVSVQVKGEYFNIYWFFWYIRNFRKIFVLTNLKNYP